MTRICCEEETAKTAHFLYYPTPMKTMLKVRAAHAVASLFVMPAALFLAGCSADGDVSGSAPSGSGQLMALWIVSSGSPDYVYKFGEGTFGGGSFDLNLDGDPPDEAINSYGIGVGVVISLPDGVDMPEDGQLSGSQEDAILDGNPLVSDRHAIIFKRADAGVFEGWPDDFEFGISCGECVVAPEGETFDGYKPASCADMVLREESESDFCNWT